MNRMTKWFLAAALVAVALVAVPPQQAEAGWGHAHGYYYTGFYAPYYGYAPAYSVAYSVGYAPAIPYATYYNYRPFYDYVEPARAWVQPLPAGGYWTAPGSAPCGCQ